MALIATRFMASTAAASTGSAVAASACPVFGHSLYIGISGSDVTALQEYLNAQGYLSVSATGYFGPLTQAAVARWQAQGGVVALGGIGSGTFGPLSRAYFARSCVNSGSGSTTQGTGFSANPPSGAAPLTVQFTSSAPQGGTIGNAVNFGDGASGNLLFAPVCSSCNLLGTVSHTYASSGTYTATLTSGTCSCPANGICNCPAIIILGTTTVTVTDGSGFNSSTTSDIQQLNAPGSVTLGTGGIAEIRNGSFYFTLASITTSTATIDLTPVGCWNSFPSDPPRMIVCMIATVPTPPQTLSVGQEYTFGNYHITLTSISDGTATFSVQ